LREDSFACFAGFAFQDSWLSSFIFTSYRVFLLDGACRTMSTGSSRQLKMPAIAVTEHGNMFSS